MSRPRSPPRLNFTGTVDGTGPDYDQWDGYPAERKVLLDFVRDEGIRNVVVLSGDVHVALAAELGEEAGNDPVAVEFVNTSLTSQNLDDKMGWLRRSDSIAVELELVRGLLSIRYVDLDSHGFSIVDLDRERLRFEWWTVEEIHERAPGAQLTAAWSVRANQPRLVPA